MKPFSLLLLCLIGGILAPRSDAYGQSSREDLARFWLQEGIKAMGGEARLQTLHSIRLEGLGHRNAIEQSERPEGPWVPLYAHVSELVDFQYLRRRQSTRAVPGGFVSQTLVTDSVASGSRTLILEAEERWALGPERILSTGLTATDLNVAPDTVLQGMLHHVITFSWRASPVRLFLNAHTLLPTAIELVRAYPHDIFLNVWGDVMKRVYFSNWTLEAGGMHYPRQWDTEINGYPYRTWSITGLALNAPAPADSFIVSEEARALFRDYGDQRVDDLPLGYYPMGRKVGRAAYQVAEGIVHLPGWWDVVFVAQDDGLVIVEAPISSGYTERILEEAGRRFPEVPVKAAISTSDAWPHFGGVREYVARDVPLYALDSNVPQLMQLITAPRTFYPDAQESVRRVPDLRVVSGKTGLGRGPNRLELYPVRGESGERMMLVYFPEHRLLYASDLVQRLRNGGFWTPQYMSEMIDVVAREGLEVETVIAMHMDATLWTEILEAVAQAKAPASSFD